MTATGGPPPSYSGPPPGGFGTAPPPPPAKARMSPVAIVAVFIGALLGLGLVAGIIVLLNTPPPPVPQCQPGEPCSGPPVSEASPPPGAGTSPVATSPTTSHPPSSVAPAPSPGATPTASGAPTAQPTAAPGGTPVPAATPTSDSPPALSGSQWRDDQLNFAFEYDESVFTVGQTDAGLAVLDGVFFDTQIVIKAVPASTSPAQLIAEQMGRVDRFVIGRIADDDPYDALLGPSIGYVRGEGGVFSGTIVSQDGTPLAPGGVTILASTDGRLTVAVLVIVGTPDVLIGPDTTHQKAVKSAADDILKTFDWD